jgi:hypothetical protein
VTHFDRIANARAEFGHVEGLADEVAGSGFEGAQFVVWLRGDDQDGEITLALDLFELLHDFEAVHDGHLKVEEDQAVAIAAVEVRDQRGIGGGFDGGVARNAEQAFEEANVVGLVIDHQDGGGENSSFPEVAANHGRPGLRIRGRYRGCP